MGRTESGPKGDDADMSNGQTLARHLAAPVMRNLLLPLGGAFYALLGGVLAELAAAELASAG